jgi:hypothetical protein
LCGTHSSNITIYECTGSLFAIDFSFLSKELKKLKKKELKNININIYIHHI